MVTRKTTGQQVSQPTTESLAIDLSKLNDKAIATLLSTARAESARRAKEKKADEDARKEAERIAEAKRKEAERIAEAQRKEAERIGKEDAEHEKARVVNVRLAQIRQELNALESEVERLVRSVDPSIVYVGFTHAFGVVSSSYDNNSQYWSSSYN